MASQYSLHQVLFTSGSLPVECLPWHHPPQISVATYKMSAQHVSTVTIYITAGDNKALHAKISEIIHIKQGYLVTAAEHFLINKFLLAMCRSMG